MALPESHLHILLALAEGDQHGYAIMRSAQEGGARLGPGALYAALGRLVDGGQIVELDERPAADLDDARRRYYRITTAGHGALTAELDRLEAILARGRRPAGGRQPLATGPLAGTT
jgi:DNA-binding PadR family transcriptional regulator